MILGIFSDIHDYINNLNKALEVFKQHKVEHAFFCGDLVSPFILKFLQDWPFAIKAVFGNNEGDKWGIRGYLEKNAVTNIEYPDREIFWDGEIEGVKVAVFHGHSPKITQNLLDAANYDLVLTGHTHEPHIKKVKQTIWINPGSVAGVSENPDVKVGTVAVFDTETRESKIIKL